MSVIAISGLALVLGIVYLVHQIVVNLNKDKGGKSRVSKLWNDANYNKIWDGKNLDEINTNGYVEEEYQCLRFIESLTEEELDSIVVEENTALLQLCKSEDIHEIIKTRQLEFGNTVESEIEQEEEDTSNCLNCIKSGNGEECVDSGNCTEEEYELVMLEVDSDRVRDSKASVKPFKKIRVRRY